METNLQVVGGLTTAGTDDVLAVTLSPKSASLGQLMLRMLRAFEAPALLLYCAELKTLIGTTDGASMELLQELWDGDAGGTLTLTPADTFGVSRRFSVVENSLGDSALADALANNYQKRTLDGLVNLAAALRFKALASPLCVLVQQATATVIFKASSGGVISAALPSFPPAGQTVGIKLVVKPTRHKSIFE